MANRNAVPSHGSGVFSENHPIIPSYLSLIVICSFSFLTPGCLQPEPISMRRFEFTEEADVVLREHTEVFHPVFEVGDAFHSHSECVAGVFL